MFILFLISLMFPATQGEDFLTRNDLFFDCGEEDYLAYVKDIQYTESGIYAVENIKGRVLKFDHSLKMQLQIGSQGEGPGELSQPYLLSVYKDRVAVLDRRGITFFDSNGKYLHRFGVSSYVTTFVYVDGKIYIIQPGRKEYAGLILTEEGEEVGSFGRKPFYKDGTPEMRRNYDADRYFSDGEILTDGTYIYYLNSRFGQIEKFTLHGKMVVSGRLSLGPNYANILAENKSMLQKGRVAKKVVTEKYSGMVKNSFGIFKHAVLVGSHIYLIGELVYPMSKRFVDYQYLPIRVVDTETLSRIQELKTHFAPEQHLQSVTSFSFEGKTGLLSVMSIKGLPQPVTLLPAFSRRGLIIKRP